MARICPLYSGSSGNSTYIGTPSGGIIIDAGASLKGIESALNAAGGKLEEIKAVAVTHEHIDHVKGLKTLLNKTKIPLIATQKTINALIALDKVPSGIRVIGIEDKPIDIEGIQIKRFATSHDCEGSSGYTINLPDGKKIAVCTDLGVVTNVVREAIRKSDVVLIESNHDIDMLRFGDYPYALKKRILSDIGHLSNESAAQAAYELVKSGTEHIMLGHLSDKNNTPEIAQMVTHSYLSDRNVNIGKDVTLQVAGRYSITEFITKD